MISKYLPLNEEERRAIIECIPLVTFEKGHILLREGQVARDSYFNINGLVREYYIIDGDEKTTNFFTEEQSISSLNSFVNQVPAKHYLECIENTTLAVLNYEKEKELFKRIPGFESLCRVSIEDEFGKQQEALANFITSSPEQRYVNLLENSPELLQRVPQYYLASYLGIKPESLSRIRKRIINKGK